LSWKTLSAVPYVIDDGVAHVIVGVEDGQPKRPIVNELDGFVIVVGPKVAFPFSLNVIELPLAYAHNPAGR
jgi:hypothetical protein